MLLKPLSEIQKMKDTDTNIECDNLLKKYARRPKILENLCLAELVSIYNLTYDFQFHSEEQSNTDEEDNTADDTGSCYHVGNLKFQKRKKP